MSSPYSPKRVAGEPRRFNVFQAAAQATIAGLILAAFLGYSTWIDGKRTQFFDQRSACETHITNLVANLTERAELANLVSKDELRRDDLAIVSSHAEAAGLWAGVNLTCFREGLLTIDDPYGSTFAGARGSADSAFVQQPAKDSEILGNPPQGVRLAQDALHWAVGAARQVQQSEAPHYFRWEPKPGPTVEFRLGCRFGTEDGGPVPDCSP